MAENRENDLHAVSQNLRDLISSLRQQREQWQVPRPAAPPPPAPAPSAPPPATATPPAPARPPAPAAVVPPPADEGLRQRAEELERENQRLYDESMAMAEQSAHLANLYVALERLHGSLEHAEVINALDEIVTGMVGSEAFALLEREPGTAGLRVVRGHGATAQRLGPLTLGEGPLGRLVAVGTPWLGGSAATEAGADVVACVPLRLGDEVTGAIVIFELLAHKPSLTPADDELLLLLARHAAIALALTGARLRPERGG